jgi:beta-galactosidase
MKGANYYIFTGGPNPPGMGTTTDDYDYGAAICSDGRIGPLYKPEKRIGKFLQENSWLALAGQLCDFRIGFDFDQQRASNYGTDPDSVFGSDKANHFFQAGVATTSFCAGLSPAGIDLSSETWLNDTRTPIFVPAADAMSERIQRNIVKFLDAGGSLIAGPVLPRTDQALRSCTILSSKAGASGFRAHCGRVRLTFDDVVNVYNTGTVFFADEIPADAQVLGIDEFTGRPVAWLRRYPSGGALIVLSFQWSHGKHEHSAMLLKLLGRLGLHQAVVGSNPNVWSTVRTDGKRAMLFAMNLTSSPMETSYEITLPERADHVRLGPLKIPGGTVLPIEI